MRLRAAVLEVAQLYSRLDPGSRGLEGEDRDQASGELERIAELWRDAEVLGSWPVERELGWEGPNDLLGAYLDSLTLLLSSDPARRAAVLERDEAVERLEAIESQGAFEQLERKGPPTDAKAESPYEDQLVERFDALGDEAIVTMGDTFRFYTELAPDGRELGARSVDTIEHLERAAVMSLMLDSGRGLVARCPERTALRPVMVMLRAMQNGLVLALSEDPARRAKAPPLEELQSRMLPVYEDLKAS